MNLKGGPPNIGHLWIMDDTFEQYCFTSSGWDLNTVGIWITDTLKWIHLINRLFLLVIWQGIGHLIGWTIQIAVKKCILLPCPFKVNEIKVTIQLSDHSAIGHVSSVIWMPTVVPKRIKLFWIYSTGHSLSGIIVQASFPFSQMSEWIRLNGVQINQ